MVYSTFMNAAACLLPARATTTITSPVSSAEFSATVRVPPLSVTPSYTPVLPVRSSAKKYCGCMSRASRYYSDAFRRRYRAGTHQNSIAVKRNCITFRAVVAEGNEIHGNAPRAETEGCKGDYGDNHRYNNLLCRSAHKLLIYRACRAVFLRAPCAIFSL